MTQLRLHRNEDGDRAWQDIARGHGVSDPIARLLWARAQAFADGDFAKAERTFRTLLEATANGLMDEALRFFSSNQPEVFAKPGKWTLSADERPIDAGALPAPAPADESPAARLLRAIRAAASAGSNAAAAMANAEPETIAEALGPIATGTGTHRNLFEVLRLADEIATLVEKSANAKSAAQLGEALPTSLRTELERGLGTGFDDVRVHADDEADAEAKKHGAIAFARGTDVYFARGQYDPSSTRGRHLIAHEVTHVAQQRGRGAARNGAMSDPGSAVEVEADRVANAFVGGIAPGSPALAIRESAPMGTISRQTAPGDSSDTTNASTHDPKEWKLNLLSQTLDLTSQLAGAKDLGGGKKQIDLNVALGPIRLTQATYTATNGKVTSGTVEAAVDAGFAKGGSSQLNVDSAGNVTGKLNLPINVPGLFVKSLDVDVGPQLSASATLTADDFKSPDFPIKASNLKLGVTAGGGKPIAVTLTGTATVAVQNGMASGTATMHDIDLKVGSDGVTFSTTVSGKLSILGLAEADADISYDGKTIKLTKGADLNVNVPGIEGTVHIHYAQGKLSGDATNLHFTMPELSSVMIDSVAVDQSKVQGKLHLSSPVKVSLPGGGFLSMDKSSIAIDGKTVSGDIEGSFAVGNNSTLAGTIKLAYQPGDGGFTGAVDVTGGAKVNIAGVDLELDSGSKLDIVKGGKSVDVSGSIGGKVSLPGIADFAVKVAFAPGQTTQLSCDAKFPISEIVPGLTGTVDVGYQRGTGPQAFTFDATDIGATFKPLDGQVIFSKLSARFQGGALTGSLTAKAGTTIEIPGGMSLTLGGGTVNLLAGKKLDGMLKLSGHAGAGDAEGEFGWKDGAFKWSADADVNLAKVTNNILTGTLHANAGDGTSVKVVAKGPVTIAASVPVLGGVSIDNAEGDRQTNTYQGTINANDAATKLLQDLPDLLLKPTGTVTVVYANGKVSIQGHMTGTAAYPKTDQLLSGNFSLDWDNKAGVSGSLSNVKIDAGEHFSSSGGTADLKTGAVNLGAGKFDFGEFGSGTVTSAINLRSGQFNVQSDVNVKPLPGLVVHVSLDKGSKDFKAEVKQSGALKLGDAATLTLGAGSTVNIPFSGDVSAHLTGGLALTGSASVVATADLNYSKGSGFTGDAHTKGGAKMTVDGIDLTLQDGSTVDLVKSGTGFQVSGNVAAKVNLPSIAEIDAHVVFGPGKPVDITVDTKLPVSNIVKDLTGELDVHYQRGQGFTFTGTDLGATVVPLNGATIFSSIHATWKSGQLTGDLTAKAGTQIHIGTTTLTIGGGTVKLLADKKLDGELKLGGQAGPGGGASGNAEFGWKDGVFSWQASADFDLGKLTDGLLTGTVHGNAGTGGTANIEATTPITVGSKVPGLGGIAITELKGNLQDKTFSGKVDPSAAVNKFFGTAMPSLDLGMASPSSVDVSYGAGKFAFAAQLTGHATFPKGSDRVSGDYSIGFDNQGGGFNGNIKNIKIDGGEYFKTDGASIDLKTGATNLGNSTFDAPGFGTGSLTGTIDVKSGVFHLESDVKVSELEGLTVHIVADKASETVTATATQGAPLKMGDLGTLTIGAGTSITIPKGGKISAHIAGAVNANNFGNGTFTFDYSAGKFSGAAHVDVPQFAIFSPFKLDMTYQSGGGPTGGFNTTPFKLSLAPEFATEFEADVTATVTNGKFSFIAARITEMKNLGKISDAFKQAGGATITYANHDIGVKMSFDIGGAVLQQFKSPSTLNLSYASKVFTLDGDLQPAQVDSAVTFTDSNIHAHWTSATKQFTVDGTAHANVENLSKVDFTVDSSGGKGVPGSFTLKGTVDATDLAQKLGVGLSSVTGNFSVAVGTGAKPDLDFGVTAVVSSFPGVSNVNATIAAQYKTGQPLTGSITVASAKIGEVTADGTIGFKGAAFSGGSLHLLANVPGLTIEGTAAVTPGASLKSLSTKAQLKVTPGATSALAQFVQAGEIDVDIENWKLVQATGTLHLQSPPLLDLKDTTVKVTYAPGTGFSAALSTTFAAPLAKNGEQGTFTIGYAQGRGLYANIAFPLALPGFTAANVSGELDSKGISLSATLQPKFPFIKTATVTMGYDFGQGFFISGSITLSPSPGMDFVVSVKYDKNGLSIGNIDSQDSNENSDEHKLAGYHHDFPTVPLATVGVASLGLKFGMGVEAGYRMPKIKFQNPKLEGGLDGLDKGQMPAIDFQGSIAMGAYLAFSLSVQIAGEIQLLIASCSAGIGAEITARLNLDLGADVSGRFDPNNGAQLHIDPSVQASLDLVASLIATLHASICWFTIVNKKWTLASTTFAHIDFGQFHPFNPIGMQFGGPGGTHLMNDPSFRSDAFDQLVAGVKKGAMNAGNEEANQDAIDHVKPVLNAIHAAAPQFEQLPSGWEKGMTTAPVNFNSMFPGLNSKDWDYYQDHADQAEQIYPAGACTTPTQKLAKAVAILAHKDPAGAGRLVLAWRRAQIANKGINPDTGVNVVQERTEVQAMMTAKYQADLAAAQAKQKALDLQHTQEVAKQAADYKTAEAAHEQQTQKNKASHALNIEKIQAEWTKAQQTLAAAASHAQKDGVKTPPAAPKAPPAPPAEPAAPKALAKPAPIPEPPKVPMPVAPQPLPMVTLPALPSDPGVSVHAAGSIAAEQKPVQPESPGAQAPITGDTPNPEPGSGNSATQVGPSGGAPMPGGATTNSGKATESGTTAAAPPPGPVVVAGPEGIIAQQKTLDAEKAQLQPAAAPAAAKPGGLFGLLGMFGIHGPASSAPPAAAPPAAAAPTTAAAPTGAASVAGAPAAGAPATGGALDPTVQAVATAGESDETSYEKLLAQQETSYRTSINTADESAQAEANKLNSEADAAHAKEVADANKQKADAAPVHRKDEPVGQEITFDAAGHQHKVWVEVKNGKTTLMVASTPRTAQDQLSEILSQLGTVTDPAKKTKLQQLVDQARVKATDFDAEAARVEEAKQTNPSADDNVLRTKEHELSFLFQQMFDIVDGPRITELGTISQLNGQLAVDILNFVGEKTVGMAGPPATTPLKNNDFMTPTTVDAAAQMVARAVGQPVVITKGNGQLTIKCGDRVIATLVVTAPVIVAQIDPQMAKLAEQARTENKKRSDQVKTAIDGSFDPLFTKVIVGAGWSAVAAYRGAQYAGGVPAQVAVGEKEPWDARDRNAAMGQLAFDEKDLKVPGFTVQATDFLLGKVHSGEYMPTGAFADAIAFTAFEKGMPVYIGKVTSVEDKPTTAASTPANTTGTHPGGTPGASGASSPWDKPAAHTRAKVGDKFWYAMDIDIMGGPGVARVKDNTTSGETAIEQDYVFPAGPLLVLGAGPTAAWVIARALQQGNGAIDWAGSMPQEAPAAADKNFSSMQGTATLERTRDVVKPGAGGTVHPVDSHVKIMATWVVKAVVPTAGGVNVTFVTPQGDELTKTYSQIIAAMGQTGQGDLVKNLGEMVPEYGDSFVDKDGKTRRKPIAVKSQSGHIRVLGAAAASAPGVSVAAQKKEWMDNLGAAVSAQFLGSHSAGVTAAIGYWKDTLNHGES